MTTAEQMPPLPPLEISWGYGDEDMHAYARAYAAQEVAREREACAVAAWSHYMDSCKKRGLPAAMCDEWCAASAIRARNA